MHAQSHNRFFRFYHYHDDDNNSMTTGLYERTRLRSRSAEARAATGARRGMCKNKGFLHRHSVQSTGCVRFYCILAVFFAIIHTTVSRGFFT